MWNMWNMVILMAQYVEHVEHVERYTNGATYDHKNENRMRAKQRTV